MLLSKNTLQRNETAMLLNTRDWSKAGALAAIGLICGIALRTPKQGDAAESAPPSHSSITDLSDAFGTVAQQVKPAVVFVQSQYVERVSTQRGPLRLRVRVAQGSGFLASSDGYIITNNHLVAGADRVTVRLYDKREFTAQVVGTDPSTDVALIKIDSRDLPTAQFGNSDSTRVGEWALAIGNPLGEAFTFTVTAGIISAKGRVLAGLEETPNAIQDFIQTDAATNPGNSGGPLVNIRGQVIGINSAIASGTGFYIGYGFAIPINLVRAVMGQLVRTGRVERAVMGLSVRDATEQDVGVVGLKQITGVVVNGYTSDDSPAKQAGIRPGDVIVSLRGEPVVSTPQLQERVGFKKSGEAVEVTLVRPGGEKKTVLVRLARAPSDAGRGGGNPSVTPNGDASGNSAAPVGAGPIYDGGTLDPVIVEARRDPTAPKRDSASARLARRPGRI
jgi:serine protease Do